ncbi:MAG: hypothetical protein ACXVW3_04235 [Nocardioidaceae bacterium]
MRLPSEPDFLDRLAVGEPPAGATRSYLPDGRCVWWPADAFAGLVLDAELASAPAPAALVAWFGDADFWARWTRAECAAKLTGTPIALWLRRHGLTLPGSLRGRVRTVRADAVAAGLVVSYAR